MEEYITNGRRSVAELSGRNKVLYIDEEDVRSQWTRKEGPL